MGFYAGWEGCIGVLCTKERCCRCLVLGKNIE